MVMIESGPLPKTERGRACRQRIITTASALIAQHGVRGTSIDDVRLAAGVSKSQFYHYFTTKAELIQAVIEYQTDQVIIAQQPLLDHLDSWEALASWADLLVKNQDECGCVGGCPLGALASELSDESEVARATLAASFNHWEQYLRRGLRLMQRRGELSAEANPDCLASALLASVQGGMLLARTQKDALYLRRALDGALAYLKSFATSGLR